MTVEDFVFKTAIAIREFTRLYGREPALIYVDGITMNNIRNAELKDVRYFTSVLRANYIKAYKGIPITYRSTGHGYEGNGFVVLKTIDDKMEFGDLDDSWD